MTSPTYEHRLSVMKFALSDNTYTQEDSSLQKVDTYIKHSSELNIICYISINRLINTKCVICILNFNCAKLFLGEVSKLP